MKSILEQKVSELKVLKEQKGIISSKFKELQKGSQEYNHQLLQMKKISEKINKIENEIKIEKNALLNTQDAIKTSIEKKPFIEIEKNKLFGTEIEIKLEQFKLVSDWTEFVSKSKTSLPSHNPFWVEIIEKTFGHNSYILCARTHGGKLIGGIPFTVISSPIFGRLAASMPYLNYGGVITEYHDVCTALMQSLYDVRQKLDLKQIEVRSIYDGIGKDPSTKKASMLLCLPDSDDEYENTVGSKVRAQYKKAEEFHPTARIGKAELLDDFYQVFSRNMRDLGTPVYAKSWFKNILLTTALNAHIIVVYVNNKPVSCGFLVNHGDLMEIPWASTLKSANKYNTNMWMYRKILSFAIQNKCKYFDFGRSTIDAGTYKFKKQWGAEPCQHYWYSILASDTPKSEINPDNPKLKIFISLWKRLPVWAANIIGPHIIKNIP